MCAQISDLASILQGYLEPVRPFAGSKLTQHVNIDDFFTDAKEGSKQVLLIII